MKKTILISLAFLFTGCTVNDAYRITNAALSKNPSAALKSIAKSKAISYSTNPKKLINDINFLSSLIENIDKKWGKGNRKVPKPKEYVKYMQNYKSRAYVDFDKGLVTVETIDNKDAKSSLKNAIITTLLLPEDPRAFDLFGTAKVKLGKTPYLYKEIKDDQNKDIRWEWRANRYANILINSKVKTKKIENENKTLKVSYVEIPMVKDHANIRVAKFKPFVQKFAKKYNLSENLVYAIIQTESNFNQFAVSHAGAIGLMQIVPSTAGIDAYSYTKGKRWKPTNSYLFNAKNNIELGSAYIDILKSKYLKGISNPISKEYCVISAYNTGAGNVLKTFSSSKATAINRINNKKPNEVYKTLRTELPYEETRNYLKKVITNKKEFISI
ncbi:lytic murein transglycosylase [Arcobacter sp. CECT 8983]|uniref:murein transglycosylase domain-containing protein n=1 Tax=Arcobacter sp. CECT 8983 TaxID=2044508 RepID=UPI00100B35D9|nr:murein transglycosylase domain-containing protein [Arcobacter sp. CECT 8983]RXJ88376.1 lytic murein transglycosylase [Arcobacter sp. CECT 8983]